MDKWKKVGRVALYAFLVLILLYQVMALIAVIGGPALFNAALPEKLREAKGLVPTWITMLCLIGGSIFLCKAWKNKEKKSLIPMVMGIIGAALALIVALTLRAALPLQAANSNVSYSGLQGLNSWKLFWRHYSPIGIGVATAIVSFMHFKRVRNERIRQENESYEDHFLMDSDPLFADDEKDDTVKQNHKKLSKKQRKEQREKENGGK